MLDGFKAAADKHGIPFTSTSAGSMFGLFFTELNELTASVMLLTTAMASV